MKSTQLSDLFYKWDINPFYLIALLVFIYPVCVFIFFLMLMQFSFTGSIISTLLVLCISFAVFYLYFHRNPNREIKKDDSIIFSPADGKIVYVKKITNGEIIESVKQEKSILLSELFDTDDIESCDGYIIGIEMRLFDVHITRSPITGKKIFEHYVSGKIVTMNHPRFEYINERDTVVIQNEDGFQVAVVQIATFLARTVKSFVTKKDMVDQGEPIGIIRFGSQVDLVIFSKDVTILVKEHDRVYGGVSKIAEIPST